MCPTVVQPWGSEDFPQPLPGPGMDAEVVKSVAKHGVDDLEDPHDRDDDGHHTCAVRNGIGADRRWGLTPADRSGRRGQIGSHVPSVAKKNQRTYVIFFT